MILHVATTLNHISLCLLFFQIVSMGIPLETAREILTSYGGDVDGAIKELQSPNSDTGTPSGKELAQINSYSFLE